MKKLAMVLMCGLIGIGSSALANDDAKMAMKMDFKMMDTNGDGMISKDEFMKFHEMMFDKMKKNSAGMVAMKDMEMMHHDMQMMHGKSDGKDHAMKKDEKSR
jgi:hypothetical protein